MRTKQISNANPFKRDVNFCVDVTVFSMAIKWVVRKFDFIREISDGLRKSTEILSFMAFILSTFEWASTPLKPFDVFCHQEKQWLPWSVKFLANFTDLEKVTNIEKKHQ